VLVARLDLLDAPVLVVLVHADKGDRVYDGGTVLEGALSNGAECLDPIVIGGDQVPRRRLPQLIPDHRPYRRSPRSCHSMRRKSGGTPGN